MTVFFWVEEIFEYILEKKNFATLINENKLIMSD